MSNVVSSEHDPFTEPVPHNETYIDHTYEVAAVIASPNVSVSQAHTEDDKEETTTDTPESPAKIPLHHVPPCEDLAEDVLDPILAAAAAGAAAKPRKVQSKRQATKQPSADSRIDIFNIQSDNDWKASLQRFASTAKNTARTIVSAATPMMHETAVVMRESVRVIADSANEITELAREVNEEFRIAMREQGENDAIHALEREDFGPALISTIISSISDVPVKNLTGKYGGYEFQPSIPGQNQLDNIEEIINTVSINELKSPLRRHRPAPVTSTPAASAFSGDFGSAYANRKQPSLPTSPHDVVTTNSQSTKSPDKQGAEQCHSEKSPSISSTPSSDAIKGNLINDKHWTLLATPKQFAELVSLKLSASEEHDTVTSLWKGRGRNRKSSRLASRSGSVTPHMQDWIQAASIVPESIFDDERRSGSRSMSPPGSPLSENVKSLEDHTLTTPVTAIIDLWDLIPPESSCQNTDEPTVISATVSVEELSGKHFKHKVILDAKPSLDLSLSIFAKDEGSISSNSDFASIPRSTDGLAKKLRPTISFHPSSTGSFCSDPGKTPVKKPKKKRHKGLWRAKLSLGALMDSNNPTVKIRRSSTCDTDVIMNGVEREGIVEQNLIAGSPHDTEYYDDLGALPLPVHDVEGLSEELLALSSLSDFGGEFPSFELPKHLSIIANLRWRQLLARWKHEAIMQTMVRRPCSLHFIEKRSSDNDSTHGSSLFSTSSSHSPLANFNCRHDSILHGALGFLRSTNNLSGFSPICNADVPFLTNYLTTLATNVNIDNAQRDYLVHNTGSDMSIDALVAIARSKRGKFYSLIEQLSQFATQNYHPTLVQNEFNVSFSVEIKAAEAIQKKAVRKYGGDVTQVKDILRSQLIFPDERFLICALVYLNQLAGVDRTGTPPDSRDSDDFSFEIVRMKNLFCVQPSEKFEVSQLPTGYRHVLLNVRTFDGFLAGTFTKV